MVTTDLFLLQKKVEELEQENKDIKDSIEIVSKFILAMTKNMDITLKNVGGVLEIVTKLMEKPKPIEKLEYVPPKKFPKLKIEEIGQFLDVKEKIDIKKTPVFMKNKETPIVKRRHKNVICPYCKSGDVIKRGITHNKTKIDSQAFRCKTCAREFSIPVVV